MNKKVLILANSDGGLYNFRKELIERLIQEGYSVFVAVPKGDRKDDLIALGCVHIELKLTRRGTNPVEDLKLLLSFRKIIKEVSPLIVLTYTIKPNIYGGLACQMCKVPYVANVTGLGTAVENPGILQKITMFLYKMGLKKAKKVFFQNSENQKFMLENKIVLGEQDLLPGSGVNLTRYPIQEYPESDTTEFVFVARIMKEKGIDQYLESATYIKNKYPNTKFHICGEFDNESYREKLEQMQNDGMIVYHGRVKDMLSIYKNVHCTVHPTYYPEGISNVLLESSACGRPIITTNRSGCREVIDDGVNGFIVNQKDSKDLIEKIEKMLSLSWEERKNMGLCGRAKVEKDFDRRIVIEKYCKEIYSVDC